MDQNAWIGLLIGLAVAGIIVGVIIGFFIAQKVFKKQLKDNPPITREQIRAMYMQMGRKPTESQINQVMNSMKKSQN